MAFDTLEKTQCVPLYRYTADGEASEQHHRVGSGDSSASITTTTPSPTEDIFAYVYAMLHDPAYRSSSTRLTCGGSFRGCISKMTFAWWAQQGQELLALHHWVLRRQSRGRWSELDQDGVTPTRAILRADKDRGVITLGRADVAGKACQTEAWEYRLGNRSALEWVLDQYKERKPRDPTIRERFNTYRFADHKERVVDLLGRVCAVSAFTTTIVNELGVRSSVELD